MSFLYTLLIILISVLLFVMIIVVHEFGHFIMAKLCGVRVNEFAIGMGPKIFKKQGKETLYTIRCIPIGGFCSMEGEDTESDDPRAFCSKKVWQRFLIVVAGAVFNIVLGLIFMIIITAQSSAYASTTISYFAEDSITNQGENALQIGDKVLEVNGYKVYCAQDLEFGLQFDPDNNGKMDFTVLRDGKKVNLSGVNFKTREDENYGQITVIDFKVLPIERNVWTVIKQSSLNTFSSIRMIFYSLFRLITFQSGANELAGPVGTATIIGEVASAGFKIDFMSGINNILNIMALITVNLGIFNLLPIPALDGGRLVFLIIEGIRRKPIKHEWVAHSIGFALLILLMLFVTYNDIIRLIKGV